jgi:hypothetical protein
MVQIPKRGKPRISFIKGHNVEDGDLATIIETPYIQKAEDSKFGKERTIITIKLVRTEEIWRIGLNIHSNDRLVESFGSEGNLWLNKQIKINKRQEYVLGEERDVLYATPSIQTKIQ